MVSQLEHTEQRVATDLGEFVKGLSLPMEAVNRTYPSGKDAGHDFVTHVAAAILDIYFKESGAYGHRHVQQPIGLLGDRGYAHQAVEGSEGFSWDYQDPATSRRVGVILEEWIAFKTAFDRTGMGVDKNTFNPDWAITSGNIVLDYDPNKAAEGVLPSSWARVIDESVPVDWRQLGRFIETHETNLSSRLGSPMIGVLKSAQQAGIGKLEPRELMDQYHNALRTLGPGPLAALYSVPNPGR